MPLPYLRSGLFYGGASTGEKVYDVEIQRPQKQVLNHSYVTIITNAGSSIILGYSVIGKH